MRTVILSVICVFFLSIYIVSSSSDLMKMITPYRFHTLGILSSSRYRYGDLYGVSFLPDFKNAIWDEKAEIKRDTCNSPARINLYCVCDSYLWNYSYLWMTSHSPSVFCGVNSVRYVKWAVEDPARWEIVDPVEIELDSTKVNVLLIERAERFFQYIPVQGYSDKIKFVKKRPVAQRKAIKIIRQEASIFAIDQEKLVAIYNFLFNKNINQNLEFNLFDYRIFIPFKEIKAQLNYKLFERSSKEVTIIPNIPYLFMNETIDPRSVRSSFIPTDDQKISNIVSGLNTIDTYYKTNGFDAVYFSVLPNPVSIISPGYQSYNDVIKRVQNHPDLRMSMINIFDKLATAPCQVYYNSDSHWNINGFNLWVNEFNSYLRKADKVKK